MNLSDPNGSSDFDRAASPSYSDTNSYDEWGQAKGGGTGQGAPLDENGHYIYSQAGMPAFSFPLSPLADIPLPVSKTST